MSDRPKTNTAADAANFIKALESASEFATQTEAASKAFTALSPKYLMELDSAAKWLNHLTRSHGVHDFATSAFGPIDTPEQTELETELYKLRTEYSATLGQISLLTGEVAARDKIVEEHIKIARDLKEKGALYHLLTRVNPTAHHKLRTSPEFRLQFGSSREPTTAFVLAIDLRRSTELMLKAREPRLFAEFLLGLAQDLRKIIVDGYGVFDKFTGDGVLAFFSETFAGKDAGLRAAQSAVHCHELFQAHYRKHRNSFLAVLKDVGLGVGIDYGKVHIVEVGGELTVVGTPVVYACRMAGTPANTTAVNQPAYERLFDLHPEFCDFREAEIDVKHEGKLLAHLLTPSGKDTLACPPPWLNEESTPDVPPEANQDSAAGSDGAAEK